MLIDQLHMAIAPKQNGKVVKPGDNALQLDPRHQKDGDGHFLFSDRVQKHVLKILTFVAGHTGCLSTLGALSAPRIADNCIGGEGLVSGQPHKHTPRHDVLNFIDWQGPLRFLGSQPPNQLSTWARSAARGRFRHHPAPKTRCNSQVQTPRNQACRQSNVAGRLA